MKDPSTGKFVAGSEIKRRKNGREFAASNGLLPTKLPAMSFPIPQILDDVQEPPSMVSDIEAWAAGLNLRGAVGLEKAREIEQVRLLAVVFIVKELGRLKDKAARAEKALALRKAKLKQPTEIDMNCPPYEDPVAITLWVFIRLAQMAYDAAKDPKWVPMMPVVKSLSSAGFLPCNAAIKEILDKAKK